MALWLSQKGSSVFLISQLIDADQADLLLSIPMGFLGEFYSFICSLYFTRCL